MGLHSVHRCLIISASLTNCSWIIFSRRRGRKYFVVLTFKVIPLRYATYHAIIPLRYVTYHAIIPLRDATYHAIITLRDANYHAIIPLRYATYHAIIPLRYATYHAIITLRDATYHAIIPLRYATYQAIPTANLWVVKNFMKGYFVLVSIKKPFYRVHRW